MGALCVGVADGVALGVLLTVVVGAGVGVWVADLEGAGVADGAAAGDLIFCQINFFPTLVQVTETAPIWAFAPTLVQTPPKVFALVARESADAADMGRSRESRAKEMP